MPSFHLMALFFAAYIHTNLPVKLFKKSSFSDRSSAKINIPCQTTLLKAQAGSSLPAGLKMHTKNELGISPFKKEGLLPFQCSQVLTLGLYSRMKAIWETLARSVKLNA